MSNHLTRRSLLRLAGGAALAAGAGGALPRIAFAAAQAASQGTKCPGKTLAAFNTPANWEDFPPGPQRDALHWRWNLNVNGWTEQAITGNPWTSNLDSPRSYYYNPLTTPIPPPPQSITRLVEWIAFPNRITTYLGPPQYYFTQDQLFAFADNGFVFDPGTLPSPIPDAAKTFLPPIPQNVCPYISSTPQPTMPYGPAGARGWMDEYCEWAVERDAGGKIVRVMFTCENAEYWFALWTVSPGKVLELYKTLVSPKVTMEDLYLLDTAGKPVHDPTIGQIAYNPLNKWNNSTRLLPDSGGAVHLTSPPNSLPAEIGLGAAATIQRTENANPQDVICCTPYGQSFRHSDPHIGYTINEAVGALNMQISIANPVGLYIQEPDFENVELPAEWLRAGLTAQQFWHLERGVPGMGLHAVFRAPDGRKDLDLSRIRINGRPLQWGSQIAQTFQVGLYGTLIPPCNVPSPQTPLGCPTAEDPAPNRPAPAQLIAFDVMRAYLAANISGDSSMAAPVIKRGQSLKNMALVTTGTSSDTAITFPGGGIQVKVRQFLENERYHVPGNTNGGTYNIFVLDLEVASDAPTGQRSLLLGTTYNAAAPAFVTVIE